MDRASALLAIVDFEDDMFFEELHLALGEFWAGVPPLDVEPDSDSIDIFLGWFRYDRPLADGRTPAEHVAAYFEKGCGPHQYLLQMSRSAFQPWEVTDVVPGESLSLRQPLEGTTIKVRERSASQELTRGAFIGARINSVGPSGQPEIDGGFLVLPMLLTPSLLDELRADRDEFRTVHGRADALTFYKHEGVLQLHDAWVDAFDAAHPEVRDARGHEIVPTYTYFAVAEGESEALETALDEHADFEPDEPGANWTWFETDGEAGRKPSGSVGLQPGILLLATMTAEAGERGRLVLEGLVESALRHEETVHESFDQRYARGRSAESPLELELDAAVQEALILRTMEQHYRSWMDEPIPALGGATPRDAAKKASLRPEVESLLRGLEGSYEHALRQGAPAYDPSWMWTELGLRDHEEGQCPPTAHERWAEHFRWGEELAGICGEVRAALAPDEEPPVCRAEDFRNRLSVRRLIDELPEDADLTEPVLVAALNHDLHQQRTFRVAESLAFTLHHTEVDVEGRDLRLPFPSFALLFTDRDTLSMAERHIAGAGLPMSGHLARVLTVFVREHGSEANGDRVLHLDFALDTLGEGVPQIVQHRHSVWEDEPLVHEDELNREWIDHGDYEELVDARTPLQKLTHTVLNAILYIGSSSANPAPLAERQPATISEDGPGSSSESISYLPGSLSPDELRSYQTLMRGDGAVDVLPGTWRRANRNWKD